MIKKITIVTAILVLLISLSACAKIKQTAGDFFDKIRGGKFGTKKISIETDSGRYEIKAEIADSAAKRQKGYMFREKIEEGTGMWFVFEDEAVRKFWMKNMKVPLDILFINKDFEIAAIKDNAQPCKKDPCEVMESSSDVKYALEVPADFVETKGVEAGDLVSEN